ncbi:ERVV2 protein, partial [Psophia crepitans]|nr:ERVV2 protein [Psophia crepitans]
LIPALGVSELEKAKVNISGVIENIRNATSDAMKALETNKLSSTALQNRTTLNMMLVSHERVCAVVNPSCWTHIDESGRISEDLK